MQIIPITSVQISPDRIRVEFDDSHIENLKTSILSKGNLSPPVLTSDNILIAGENRFRAIQKISAENKTYSANGQTIPSGSIAILRISDLSADDLLEAELEENVIRKPLTWQEETKAHARLHSLRIAQKGSYNPATKTGQTIRDTVKEITGKENYTSPEYTNIADSLHLAEYLNDPMISACSTKEQAKKLIVKQQKTFTRLKKAALLRNKVKDHRLYHHSYNDPDFMLTYAQSFDVIIADPPYGKDMHKQSPSDMDKHEYDDSRENFNTILEYFPAYLNAMTKPDAHIYIFCDIERFREILTLFFTSSFTCWTRPIIWSRGNVGYPGDWKYGPRATYDAIFYARKGNKPTLKLCQDVIDIRQTTRSEHPAEKPKDLYLDLLSRSAEPGSLVFEPFSGRGNIFLAAEEAQCTAIATDISEKYYHMSLETLNSIHKEQP